MWRIDRLSPTGVFCTELESDSIYVAIICIKIRLSLESRKRCAQMMPICSEDTSRKRIRWSWQESLCKLTFCPILYLYFWDLWWKSHLGTTLTIRKTPPLNFSLQSMGQGEYLEQLTCEAHIFTPGRLRYSRHYQSGYYGLPFTEYFETKTSWWNGINSYRHVHKFGEVGVSINIVGFGLLCMDESQSTLIWVGGILAKILYFKQARAEYIVSFSLSPML